MHLKNKKHILKRGVAVLAAALMLVQSPLGAVTAYADAVTQVGTDMTVSGNEIVSGNSAEMTSQQLTAQPGDLLLEYAYIESAQISPSQEQNILIAAGEGNVAWESATLTLLHAQTGEEKEVALSDFTENVLRFSFDTTGMQAGIYRVAKLVYSYKEDGVFCQGSIDFARIEGMENISFGLGVDNPLSQSEFTEYDADGRLVARDAQSAEELVDVNVVSLTGAQENLDATRPVAQAVEQAVAEVAGSEKISSEKGEMKPESDEAGSERKIAGSLVVMLDPGHDDTHAGARANGLEEEDLTLKVAEYCKEYLEDTYSDVAVYMSRPSEACPYPGTTSGDCNANRVDDAYRKGADVYVSLHFNSTAGSSTTATGSIVFYPNSNYDNDAGSEGATLASKIIEQLAKLGLKNNGIQIRNSENNTLYPDGSLADYYGVIRRSKEYGIPAVIVEHAFLNNAQDAAFLQDEKNIKKLGIADALGIAQAYGLSTEEVEFDAEELKVTEIDGGNGMFKITLGGASPVKRIANVKFKVYPTANKNKSYTYTAELVDKKTGTYSVTGNVGEHGKLEGKYKVIAYAFDAAGKKTQLRSTTFTITKTKIDTTGMKVTTKVFANEKKVTLNLVGNENAAGVFFKVKSKQPGAKTKTYQATKQKNGQWRAYALTSKHKDAGEYVVTAYTKTYFGTNVKVATGAYTIAGPTAKSLGITKMNLTKGTFRAIVKGVAAKAGVKKVSIAVKTLDGKKVTKNYTPKKAKNGNYYIDVNMKDFGYQYGRYQVEVTVTDKNGVAAVVATHEKDIAQPQPVLSAKLVSKQSKLKLTASNLGISANVKGVRFRVTPMEDTKAKKDYVVTKASNGTYSKTISLSDFGMSGKYKIVTFVKGANGKYKSVGKAQYVTVADIEGGAATVKKRNDSSSFLIVSDIEYPGAIQSVQVKAWPVSNKKAKYVYKATERSGGTYRATLHSKNHKGIGGEYKYQVIVTAKNGLQKTLLTGKMTLGQSEAENGELYPITGASEVTVAQMVAYYKKNATYPTFYSVTDAPTLKKFCQMYYNECEKEGIRAEVAFAQAMHETNFLRYGGDVNIAQFNFAGIGATGNGAPGNSFETVRIGIRAQVQHLKAYANNEALAQACVDPRFTYVQRGCAPYVEWLSIPNNPYGKGWATNPLYGSSLRQMIAAMRNC